MSITVQEVLQLKRAAEIEIVRVVNDFQQKTGLMVSGISHYVADVTGTPPKAISATVHVELK